MGDTTAIRLAQTIALIRDWEKWEAGIIMDDSAWKGSLPVLTQPTLDALSPLAARQCEFLRSLEAHDAT